LDFWIFDVGIFGFGIFRFFENVNKNVEKYKLLNKPFSDREIEYYLEIRMQHKLDESKHRIK
jgi:hypothetical protein